MRRALLVLTACFFLLAFDQFRVTHVNQRGQTDCVVAVMAMAAGVSYETSDSMRLSLGMSVHNGLSPEDVVRLGEGLNLKFARKSVLVFREEVEAVIVFNWNKDDPYNHAAYLHRGMVHDPLAAGPVPYATVASVWRVAYALHVTRRNLLTYLFP
jgi:ABC-type bacteriocin/lantibiotic exporter with double-glycine peptidase domain